MADTKTVTFDAEQIMEQAQVFASAWSLVGGCFDNGSMLAEAESAKAELRTMIEKTLAAAPTPAAQSAGQEAGLPSWWPAFIQNVCELPDRTSPEDEPEAMVATAEELESCAMAAIEAASEDESPATDTDEAGALRAFDRAKQKGHSHDLESYCAGYIDRGYAAPVQSAGQEPIGYLSKTDAQWLRTTPDVNASCVILRRPARGGMAIYAGPVQSAGQEAVAITDAEILGVWALHDLKPEPDSETILSFARDILAAPVNGGERELGQVIDERDQYHDAAEKLADAIAKHFGVEIGEHSNLNCPWQNALDHIAQATKRTADAQQVGQMSDRQIIELCKSVGVEWEGPDMCDFMGDFGRVNMAGMRAIINAAKEQK